MKKVVILFWALIILWVTPVLANEKVEVEFSKCVDGDTAKFILDEEEITARFLAIDTPETVHPSIGEEPFGKEASNYTCDKLTNAKKIVLEYDDGSDKTDKYNRHLVWVYYDDKFLQEELLELGYAEIAYLYGNYKYTSDLQNVEVVAKSNKVGIWGDYEFIDVEEKYTVTFYYDGEEEEVIVIGGNAVSPISNPKKENYKFLGWHLNGEIYDFSLPVEENIELVAKFEIIEDEYPIWVYIVIGIIILVAIITNYNGSRTKVKRKLKSTLKKKLMKN